MKYSCFIQVNDENNSGNETFNEPHYQTLEEVREEVKATPEEVQPPSSPSPPPPVPVPQPAVEAPVVEPPEVLFFSEIIRFSLDLSLRLVKTISFHKSYHSTKETVLYNIFHAVLQ